MSCRTTVAIIGLGSMGRHHARVLASMSDVAVVALADSDPSALEQAGPGQARLYENVEHLLERERLDAVIVATPTGSHASIASAALHRDLPVLVEKPIASSPAQAAELVALAERRGVILAVGHVERFNPAVRQLKHRLEAGELGRLFHVRMQRAGPFPDRVADVGVTVDLATHDLDVLSYLLEEPPEMIFAQVSRRVHDSREDLLLATLRYPGGVLATLHVDWLTPTKLRRASLTGERGVFTIDYLTQDLIWYENGEVGGGWDALDTLRGVSEGRVIRYPVPHREPLSVELAEFVRAVRGAPAEIVQGTDGLSALSLAFALLDSASASAVMIGPFAGPAGASLHQH